MSIKPEILAAVDFLHSLKQGERVTVSEGSRKLSPGLYVSRTARRSDGAFGSVESTQVTISYGPGRYSFEVSADAIGNGRYTVTRDEPLTNDELRLLRSFRTDGFFILDAASLAEQQLDLANRGLLEPNSEGLAGYRLTGGGAAAVAATVLSEDRTWTFIGHWEHDRIVVEWTEEGEVQDDREDTGQYPEGLWAAAASGPDIKTAQAAAIAEYEDALAEQSKP